MVGLRVRKLILEHFSAILAGTGKERIELDLTNVTNRFIVFIGPIGTGKTFILSHLQPYANVGSLDVRNMDDPIIPGKDGKKVIEYETDEHEIVITHDFIWTGKTHTKKHFITKDGTELNPNGNRSSFLELIQLEFGIDESYLRLIRIGSNVSNFINMKATERKAFIANLLKDTEVYLYLYKHWSAELRELNSRVNILMNKITTFSKTPLDELKAQMEDLEDDRKEYTEKCDHLKEKRSNIRAEANVLLGSKTVEEFMEFIRMQETVLTQTREEIDRVEKDLSSFTITMDDKEINKKIGKAESDLGRYTEERQKLSDSYEDLDKEYQKLCNKRALQGDPEHLEMLKKQYEDMLTQMRGIEKQIEKFECKYSTSQLETLLEDLQAMSVVLNQVIQYDKDSINFVFRADSSIIQYSNKKVEILNARKAKVQRLMSNLQFSEEYRAQQLMFLPPFCPTKTCPYYATHPVTIRRKEGGKAHFEPKMIEYQEEIRNLDVDIYRYNDYPFIYSKIVSLREYWKNVSPMLREIGALQIDHLKKVIDLSGYHSFYDYDKIINTIDLVKKRNLYYELTESIKSIRNELNQLEINKDESLDTKIEENEKKRVEIQAVLEEKEEALKKTREEIDRLNEEYLNLSKHAQLTDDLRLQKECLRQLQEQIGEMKLAQEKINDCVREIEGIDRKLVVETDNLNTCIRHMDDLRTKINDITYTTKELEEISKAQKYMTAMCDAVGSKKGIPMKMVKLFFDSCRGTINEFLYMVSEDNFEILDFNVTEKEFKIPYYTGGMAVDDISKASQGQSSLASIAISFALVKELAIRSSNGNIFFNTVLLDEPDSAIHKTDKPKLLSIMMKFLDDIQSNQCFIITHNDDLLLNASLSPQIVLTSNDEVINQDKYPGAIFL